MGSSVQHGRPRCGTLAVIWLVRVFVIRKDRWVFAVRSLKFIYLIGLISTVTALLHIVSNSRKAKERRLYGRYFFVEDEVMDLLWGISSALTLAFATAGIRRTALIPYIGPFMASFISQSTFSATIQITRNAMFSKVSFADIRHKQLDCL